jgi:ABC-type lipoprotein release transport system permease subunit
MGQGYHGAIAAGKYRIIGIVKFGLAELNDQSLYLSLSAAQELYSADELITSFVLALAMNPWMLQQGRFKLPLVVTMKQ